MFNIKKTNLVFIATFILIAMVAGGCLLFVDNSWFAGFKKQTVSQTVDSAPCRGDTECVHILDSIYKTKAKDSQVCSRVNNYYWDYKAECYLIIANNTGDESLCDKIEPARTAEFCRLGIRLINKELILSQQWGFSGGNNLFYADKDAFIESERNYNNQDMINPGKTLDLPVKVILLELDNKNFVPSDAWSPLPEYYDQFNGAKVKFIDGRYAGREGWLEFDAIVKNQPLSPVNEKKGDKCGDSVCNTGETAINCPEDCDPSVCLNAGATYIPNGIKQCCPGTEVQKITNACIPTEDGGCSYGDRFICEWSYMKGQSE